MEGILEPTVIDRLAASPRGGAGAEFSSLTAEKHVCFHCSEPCPDTTFSRESKVFCCHGCLVVHDLLAGNGLSHFYELERHPGVRVRRQPEKGRWAYLDDAALQEKLLDFSDGKMNRITFKIPTIHCIACVWLLENLFKLHQGIGRTCVNFPKREVQITFSSGKITLSELVELLSSIGYEPQLTLNELEKQKYDPARKRQWLQVGIAGFAFGNIMLLSLPLYLGLDSLSGVFFRKIFGILSLILAAPVLCYSASDYWRAARISIRQRVLTLDVPIALGLAALYAQSAYDILASRSDGYLDSMSGLVFFLLCGRVFQQRAHDRIAFDRDFKCFFPLAVTRKNGTREEGIAISNLQVGDRVLLRNGELIPGDSRLISGQAVVDYSFVTGESEPAPKNIGDYLYAGGKQTGGAIELEIVKPVSQSYLTSLWNHETFRKEDSVHLNSLTNRYSRRFTAIVITVAVGAASFWLVAGDATRALRAFTSVLIVACPCALALAAPFTLGTAQRCLARIRVFLKNVLVLERLAHVHTIVFDKTGTLTTPSTCSATFVPVANPEGTPAPLGKEEGSWTYSLTRHSTHPHARRIAALGAQEQEGDPVFSYLESPGKGLEGVIAGHEVRIGSGTWLRECGVQFEEATVPSGSLSGLCVDGRLRGWYVMTSNLRPDTESLLRDLNQRFELALLSGDNEKDRERFRTLFGGSDTCLHFNQSPLDKLGFIQKLQDRNKTVLMVGDGLNDAGALKQSDVGAAVVENVGLFSPASDMILTADQVPQLSRILEFSRKAVGIVRLSFGISAAYNLLGISIAAMGILSPVICAILMPLSSISVVLFACSVTRFSAHKLGIRALPGDVLETSKVT